MWLIDKLAEQRIEEARLRGELDNLPGMGRPQRLDDDSMVPQELRAAYRVLKNAGYLPPEAQLLGEVREVEALLARSSDPEERASAVRRLNLLQARMGDRARVDRLRESDYRERVAAAMEGERNRDG